MTSKRYSLAQIKQSYEESEGVDFYKYSLARYFFRPLSFYGSWLFLRLGITANQTTAISWVMVLLGCFLYAVGPLSQNWLPIILILSWAILDYMDGSMARVTNTRSKYGHFIDVVGAYLMLAYLPICLSIGLYKYPEHSLDKLMSGFGLEGIGDPVVILALGAFTALNNILLRLIVLRMQLTFNADPRAEKKGKKGRISRLAAWIEALISPRGFFFPLIIAATWFERLEWFVALYFAFYTGALIAYTGMYVVTLRSTKE